MGGFLFRLGVRLKDKGEQWKCNWLVRLGLKTRDFVYRRWRIENGKIKLK